MLDRPWPTGEALSDRQQAVVTKIDREQLEARLGWLRNYREAIERWSQWHEAIQVVVRHVRRYGIGRDSVATLRSLLAAKKLSPSGRDAADTMLIFVGLHATMSIVSAASRPDG